MDFENYFEDVRETEEIVEKLRKIPVEPGNWIKKIELMHELDNNLLEELHKLHERHQDVPEITVEIMKKAEQLENVLEEIKKSQDINENRKQKLETLTQQINELYAKEVEKDEKFISKVEKYIVENIDSIQFFIHETDVESAKQIAEEGLKLQKNGLYSYANRLKGENLKQVLKFLLTYSAARSSGGALVIIGLNRKLMEKWQNKHHDTAIQSPHATTGGAVNWPDGKVHPELIVGYVDRATKEFVLNESFESGKAQKDKFPTVEEW